MINESEIFSKKAQTMALLADEIIRELPNDESILDKKSDINWAERLNDGCFRLMNTMDIALDIKLDVLDIVQVNNSCLEAAHSFYKEWEEAFEEEEELEILEDE